MGTRTCTWEPVWRPKGPREPVVDPYMHVGAGLEAHRPERAAGDRYTNVAAGPEAHRPEGAAGYSVGTGLEAHRSEEDSYRHMETGPEAHRPKGAGGDQYMHVSFEPVRRPTGPRGPLGIGTHT